MMQMRSGIGWLSKDFCVVGHPFIFNPSAAILLPSLSMTQSFPFLHCIEERTCVTALQG